MAKKQKRSRSSGDYHATAFGSTQIDVGLFGDTGVEEVSQPVAPQKKAPRKPSRPTRKTTKAKKKPASGADSKPTRALSIRQPHAEAIMRGVKPIEFRTRSTQIRERIYIYASLGRYDAADEASMLDEYGIYDVASDDLPRGVIIGSVELYDCTDGGGYYEWHMKEPVRAEKLLKPKNHPQPVWFTPF